MSHQCSCGRDLNNNYVSYTNAYANANSGLDRDTNSAMSGKGSGANSAATSTQLTAKVMFGTVGAIKEMREKEKSRHATTRADLLPFWLLLLWSMISLLEFTQCANISLDVSSSPDNSYSELPRPLLSTAREAKQISDNIDHDHEERSRRPSLVDIALQISARQGLDAMTELYTKIEPDMIRHGQLLEENHPAALLSKFSAPTIDKSKPNPEMAAFAVLTAAKAFRKNYKYINELGRQAHSPKISLRRTALESLCPPREPPTCMPAAQRYRTHDGTCNNKRRPRWGAAQMPFNRFLPPVYGDGVDSIRNSVEGGSLSSSRFVSLLVHGAKDGEAPLTLMIAQWGQLLDHDMTSTAQPRSINGSVPSCCGGNDFHPSCFPIKVPLDDPWLAPLKVRCLEFLRSAPAQRRDCVLSWREQTNQATSFIDASPIYSNNAKSADNARVFRDGLLIYGRGNPSKDACQRGAIANQCIRSGDGRSGEQPGLLALHHVWVGEHNRIATQISEMNPHWSDEKIYQETRRIVGAMFQHITYREFLPLILGKEVCKLFDLELLSNGFYDGYDSKVNPTVANSFSAAAFRFGHSLVQNSYMRCDRHHNVISNNVSLHEEFQRGDIGSAGSLHRLIRGMATQRALKRDEFITPELTNHLFQTPGFPFGLDLAAINIQRGRDHGVPSYTAWRIPCGLTQVNTWEDFDNVVGPESAQRIRHAYRSVHDIDLFVGGIAERPVVGGLVGPTFACIIAQQFSNSRKGDRFWYENGNFESSFTPAQLHAIRRVSLAQVLCRAVDGGTFQPHIFIPPEFEGNSRIQCGEGPLAPIDLTAWQEQDPFGAPIPESSQFSQLNFEAQNPDRVFDIISSEDTSNPLTTVHVIKDNKVGFSNLVRPSITNVTSGTTFNRPQVNLIPNASIGLHRPTNLTKVSDKLDIRRKGSTTRRPGQSHIIGGVNNKLDKNTKINLNIKGINRHRIHTTTRRTVIVNNIPIELRNAGESFESQTTIVPAIREPDTTTPKPVTSIRPKQKKRKNRPKSEKSQPKVVKAHKARLDEDNKDMPPRQTTTEDILVFHDDDNEFMDSTTLAPEDIFDIFHSLTERPTANSDIHVIEANDNFSDEYEDLADSEERNITPTNDMDNDIDPMIHTEPMTDNKRVQREIVVNDTTETSVPRTPKNVKNTTKSRPLTSSFIYRNSSLNTSSNSNRTITKIFSIRGPTSTPVAITTSKISASAATVTKIIETTTTPRPRTKKTTEAPPELRQYQTRQAYTRPHKVIVKGPNSDQYEIEINIRQTNSALQTSPITSSYPEYPNSNIYQPYNIYDRYSPYYANYVSTTPTYPYYQPPPPTVSSTYTQGQRTRPPTVIYINENERDERTTTRQPNIFQNIINFATNGLRPPLPASPVSSVSSGQKEKPSNTHNFPNSPHSSNQYGLNTQPQPGQPISVSSLSQTGGLHAASGAVSSGNFGTIVGVASSNGGDSAFSFNIRPKPSTSAGSVPLKRPNYNPISSPEYVNLPLASPSPENYYENSPLEQTNSPFSSHKRPSHHSGGYYSRTPGPIENSDYDYSSRMLLPLSNVSSILFEEDYQYKDEYDNYENLPPAKKYDRDGYLRPEHMVENLYQNKDTSQRSSTISRNGSLDDNYVLPMMNGSLPSLNDVPKPMHQLMDLIPDLTADMSKELPDTQGKNLNNDIQAETDYMDETTEPFLATKSAALKVIQRSPPKIAFAPIKVLTKPERPDNWVIFDTPVNKPLLPEPPEVNTDRISISEVPKPITELSGIWLRKEEQKVLKDTAESQTESEVIVTTHS